MHITRRHVLTTALLCTTALAGCTGLTLTPAAVITEAQSIASGLSGALAQIPSGIISAATLTTIQTDLTLAIGAAKTLTANAPAATGASTVQTINGWINAVLNTVASLGIVPAPFNLAVSAAALLMPDLEAFVDQFLPSAAPAAPVVAAAAAPGSRAKLAAATPSVTKGTALGVLQGFAAQ